LILQMKDGKALKQQLGLILEMRLKELKFSNVIYYGIK
jgi:hypothetical protein